MHFNCVYQETIVNHTVFFRPPYNFLTFTDSPDCSYFSLSMKVLHQLYYHTKIDGIVDFVDFSERQVTEQEDDMDDSEWDGNTNYT